MNCILFIWSGWLLWS